MPDAIGTPVAITNQEPWQLLLPLSQGSLARPAPQASDVTAEGRKSKGQWMEGHQPLCWAAGRERRTVLSSSSACGQQEDRCPDARYCLFLREFLLLEGGGSVGPLIGGSPPSKACCKLGRGAGRLPPFLCKLDRVVSTIVPGCDIWVA